MPRHVSQTVQPTTPAGTDPPLSEQEVSALRQACAPVGLLNFPPPEIIRALRQYGYVTIVIGGLQITQRGLERLLRERQERQFSNLR